MQAIRVRSVSERSDSGIVIVLGSREVWSAVKGQTPTPRHRREVNFTRVWARECYASGKIEGGQGFV